MSFPSTFLETTIPTVGSPPRRLIGHSPSEVLDLCPCLSIWNYRLIWLEDGVWRVRAKGGGMACWNWRWKGMH